MLGLAEDGLPDDAAVGVSFGRRRVSVGYLIVVSMWMLTLSDHGRCFPGLAGREAERAV